MGETLAETSTNESNSQDADYFSQNPFDVRRYEAEEYESKTKKEGENKNESNQEIERKSESSPKTILKKAGERESSPKDSTKQTHTDNRADTGAKQKSEVGKDQADKGNRFRLKINGESKVVSRPDLLKLAEISEDDAKGLSDAQVVKIAQIQESSKQRFKEAAELKRNKQDVEAIFKNISQLAKQDPLQLLKKLGANPDEIINQRIEKMIQESELSEEQVKLKRYEEDAKLRSDQEVNIQREREKEYHIQKVKEYAEENTAKMLEAWKETELPNSPYFGSQMAGLMLRATANGKDLTWRQAASIVKREFYTRTKELVEKLDAPKIKEVFGDAVLEKLRQHFVDVANGSKTFDKKETSESPKSAKRKSTPGLSELDWIDSLKSMYN